MILSKKFNVLLAAGLTTAVVAVSPALAKHSTAAVSSSAVEMLPTSGGVTPPADLVVPTAKTTKVKKATTVKHKKHKKHTSKKHKKA